MPCIDDRAFVKKPVSPSKLPVRATPFREWLPVAVLLGFIPLGASIVGALAYSFPHSGLWVVLSAVVVGGFGIYFGDWPPVEYALLLGIAAILAGLLLPVSIFTICLPGAVVGYLWGGYFATIVDKPNVDRLREATRDESVGG